MSNYSIETKTRVLMERPEPTFFAKIPKMAQLELDPYELALYTNYKQTASDSENGAAWKSNKTLAQECRMSIRKVQEARKSLEAKGYIQSTYTNNENDSVSSPVTVTIVDVWEENHKRFAKDKTPAQDAKPLHKVHTPMQEVHTTPAQGAYKEESFNKNQEINKDSTPTPLDTLQEMAVVVRRELKQYGSTATKLAKMLLAELSGKQAEYNLETPISPEQLTAFCLQWDKKLDRNGKPLARPSNMGSLKRNIEDWQKATTKPKAHTPLNLAQRKAPANLALLEGRTA